MIGLPKQHGILAAAIAAWLAATPSTQAVEPGAAGDVWNQWRGPTRDGRFHGPPWPESLKGKRLKVAWRVALGPGYSGPIVTPGRVFVAETRDEASEVVRALDRRSGREIWQTGWKGAMKVPFFARANGSWIRSTPAWDGGRLYVAGMRDVLVCLDGESGKELWRADFVERLNTPLPSFGFVSSPLVVGGHVYVQAGASFIKLDKMTGNLVWRTLDDGGGMYGSAFSSPIKATLRERDQILVQTRSELAGVEPQTGDVLWRSPVEAFRGMNILTPTVHGDSLFTSSYGGGSILLDVRRGEEDGLWSAERSWRDTAQGYMSSPVVVDGHVYLHLRNRRMTCFELETGERRWTTTERFGNYMSLVARDDRILALDERGLLLLIHAQPESFRLIDSRRVAEEPAWAHLAVCDGQVFVRELHAIAMFDWGSEELASAAGERGR